MTVIDTRTQVQPGQESVQSNRTGQPRLAWTVAVIAIVALMVTTIMRTGNGETEPAELTRGDVLEELVDLGYLPEEFFAASWEQYEGVETVDRQMTVMAEAPGSVWADVTWSFEGQARERFCYQLIEGADGYQIAVLTPMELASG